MLEAMSLIEYLQASPGIIIFLMFASLMALMLTGQRVFGVMGFVGVAFALVFIDRGSLGYGFNAAIKLFNWYPMLTLPMFVFMGFMLSESGIANDMYHMFHVWFGGLRGGLAVGTLLVMIMISCMNGLSVAGMAIGCSVALPELLKRNYDKRMISGVIQAGSSLGILFPPSIVLVLYGMIAREQVKDLWLAGVGPALLLSLLFFGYVVVRCRINPKLGPVLPKEQRNFSWAEKLRVLRAGILPILLVLSVIGSFFSGLTSLEESSAVGALAAFLIALFKGRLTRKVFVRTLRETLNNSAMFLWIMMAALSFSGATSAFPGEKAVVIDVGGGSTEIIAGMAGGALEHAHSFQIGCRRVTERFFTQDPPGAELVGKAAEWIADEMAEYLGMLIEGGYMAGRVIAVAGTATSIVSMREEMEVYDSTRVHGAVVTRADLDALIAKLQDMPLVDRQRIVGLNPQRAPVILAGIVILQQIMEVTGIDEFTVSESDILQGVVLATASR